ncbi:MAG: hypothetical protein JWP91_1815 [Fibrobacteres bacterium]|nr:hypothetical protein [Fibrobacterota bacterium]
MQDSGQKIQLNAAMAVMEDRFETVCKGIFQRNDVVALVDSILDNISRHPELKKCLVDIRGAEMTLGIMGEYIIGEYAAKKLAGLRIALIQAPGQVKKLLEDTAYNRGLRIQLVDDRQDALDWLNK